ncbi:MAG: FAD-dependent oxidoreductase [Candidatus Omnitrophica bacterium]|nr:FAD-dependent oxidoreductase [Candidatus Omnitrophota bacterium]
MKKNQNNDIVIVGGGLLGLSIAYFLSRGGVKNITVVEKDDELGGACSWFTVDKTVVTRFYHVIMAQDEKIFRFMDELGLRGGYGFTTVRMGIFNGKTSHPINTPREFLFYPDLSLFNKLRLAYTILYCRFYKDWRSIESLSASDWLISIGGEQNFRNIRQPIIRSKFGDNLDRMAAVDMLARIARISSSRKADFSQRMAHITGTPKTLIDRLENILGSKGVRIIKGNGAKRLLINGGEAVGVSLDDGQILEAGNTVFTVPIPEFEKLIPETYQSYKNSLKHIQYLDNVCLVLKLSKPLTPFYMLNIQDNTVPFTGVIGLSHIYPENAFDGHAIFYISRYIFNDDGLFTKEKDEILADYLPYLKKINPEFRESWISGYGLSKRKNVEAFHSINYPKYIPKRETIFKGCFLVTAAQSYPESTVIDTSVNVAEGFAAGLLNRRERAD